MSQNMLKITLKTATLMLLSSGLYACATSQPLISPEMDHYGRIDVSRPEIQVPNSVKPLMDVWLRDTYVNLGHDGYYYMTGTFKSEDRPTAYDSSPGLVLWRSKDLKNWEDLGVIFDLNNIDSWQKDFFIDEKMKRKLDLNGNEIRQKRRTLWAAEIHYIKSQKNYFVIASVPENPHGKGSYILRSTSGKAEGPYVNIKGNENGPIYDNIDGSLFEDDDGSVYLVAHNHFIAKMKDDMSDIAEPYQKIKETEYSPEPYIEGAYMFKENGKYHLVQAIWSMKMPDGSFTYEKQVKGKIFKTPEELENARYGYDVVIATADSPYGPFGKRYTSAIGAGHNNLFKDKDGQWWMTMFGNPRGSLPSRNFIARPAIVPMRIVDGKFYPLQDE